MTDEPRFDVDPSRSDLKIGLEVEYPKAKTWDEDRFRYRSRKSSDLHGRMDGAHIPSQYGRTTWDGTVGLEQVSEILDLEDAVGWYADVIDYVEDEWNAPFGYTSLLPGSTAGLHMHLSPLSDEQARRLYEISTEPWAQALFCSAIVSDENGDDWTVFRDNGYARTSFNSGRYSLVHRVRNSHWEWRMPEPMTVGNLEITVNFLRIFEQDPDEAVRYAQRLLDSGDDRITSIKRAEMVGIDVANIPDIYRSPREVEDGFFETVYETWGAPEIYKVVLPEAENGTDTFYAFQSQMDGMLEIGGHEIETNGVYYADEIERVTDDELRRTIRSSINRDGNATESAATKEVKKALKKKKDK